MPRGRRPSTAALTRLGARKASEMVILTCRTLHFSRAQSSATVVTRPEITSSSREWPAPHLNCGIAGTLMRGGGGAATPEALPTRLGLANMLAAPICAPSAAFGRLPPIAAPPPPRPPPPFANEAAGVAKTRHNARATFTFTEVFDMGKLH